MDIWVVLIYCVSSELTKREQQLIGCVSDFDPARPLLSIHYNSPCLFSFLAHRAKRSFSSCKKTWWRFLTNSTRWACLIISLISFWITCSSHHFSGAFLSLIFSFHQYAARLFHHWLSLSLARLLPELDRISFILHLLNITFCLCSCFVLPNSVVAEKTSMNFKHKMDLYFSILCHIIGHIMLFYKVLILFWARLE